MASVDQIYKGNYVTLRKKTLKDKYSLYLDIYYDGIRKKKYLGLKVSKNKRPTVDDRNTIDSAIAYLKKVDTEIIEGRFNIVTMSEYEPVYVIPFIHKYIEERTDLQSTSKKKYLNTALHFERCFGKKAEFLKFTETDIEKFKTYLKSNLSNNSADSYFAVVKTIFREAKKRNLIDKNVTEDVKGIGKKSKLPVYLTEEELRLLQHTECSHTPTKDAFIFSCYTGLRYSDACHLMYKDLFYEDGIWQLRLSQAKTNFEVIVPIHEKALELIQPFGAPNTKVFDLRKDDHTRNTVRKWAKGAGITKNITFHVARHTFATRLITNGTDLYTVSKLLGHTDIKHTQIYAQVIDKVKVDAVMGLG
jgi:site-specific recombinase XerD